MSIGMAFCMAEMELSPPSAACRAKVIMASFIVMPDFDAGRVHAVDADRLGGERHGQLLHEPDQPGLGRGVGHLSDSEAGAGRSPAVELVMTMEPPGPPARSVGSATETVFHAPVRLVSMMSRHTASGSPPSAEPDDAGVGDDDVDPPERRHALVEGLLEPRPVPHVRRQRHDLTALASTSCAVSSSSARVALG